MNLFLTNTRKNCNTKLLNQRRTILPPYKICLISNPDIRILMDLFGDKQYGGLQYLTLKEQLSNTPELYTISATPCIQVV